MLQTIIKDVQQLIADIEAKNWLTVASDFAKLMADVVSAAGSIEVNDPGTNDLKASLHDLHVSASAAGGSHPILAGLLQAIIQYLPTILQIITTSLPVTTGS